MVTKGQLQLTLPADMADIVRSRMSQGRFASAEDVVRAALALLGADQGGEDRARLRAEIEDGWRQAASGPLSDSSEASIVR